jgi:hypothetical protein
MATVFGVGYTENPKSFEAGAEMAKQAMSEAGIEKCDLAILYSTSKQDPVQLGNGVRSVIGPTARLIGGYSMGIITNDYLGYEGYQAGIAVMSSDSINIDMFITNSLPSNEINSGIALGEKIKSKNYKGDPNIIIMYDAIKEPNPTAMSLNLATPLIKGIEKSIGTWPRAAGVGMMGDFQWNRTYQWFDDKILQDTAMALVLSGGVRMDTIIMHGCKPSSDYHKITKADGNVVLEIDGKPAVEMIANLLGENSGFGWQDFPLFVTLGVNKGDKYGEFKEEEYANRLCMAVDKERGGLVMFEPDLEEGSEVQLMRRSIDFQYIGQRAQILLDGLGDRKPVFALYIDCAGRASAYCGTESEEAEEVQKVIGSKMPLLGMFSGVEIAKVGNDMQALDWTGVLCVFSE